MTKARDFLGPYRLARLIRAGSSCQVWEAIESGTNARYALKVLRSDCSTDKQELMFLRNEYDIAAQLSHPYVIKVHKLVMDPPTPFIALELFSELNMKQALRRGPDSLAFMLDKIIEHCTEGLYYMHSKGFVHCDVKPDNFLVSREGEVKLIDFTISQKMKSGIARFFSGKAKNVQGTLSYMAPEQIRGESLDQRADVYSFGCVLFELVTGKPPFTGTSPNELLNKHISASIPSPLVANDNVTPEFANLLKTMMAKKPEARTPSMWEILKQVRAVRIFKKPPRIPETSIFDEFPTSGQR
ncbi:MAG: serine/threonine protein kinase [Pirellulaceae bacterium]|nr:serine/threonine protein kinase [Pirellulaceae bacterium]